MEPNAPPIRPNNIVVALGSYQSGSDRMRILYILPHYGQSAMGNRIHTELIDEWRSEGVEVEILSFSAEIRQPTRTIEEGIVVHRLPASGSLSAKIANALSARIFPYPYLASVVAGFRRFFAKHTYDLCHIETAFPLAWAAVLAGKQVPPLALTLPGADVMAEPEFDYGYARFRIVRAILPIVFRRVLVIRADSPQIREAAIALGAEPDKVIAIPYNITNSSFPPAGEDIGMLRARSRAALVARYNLDPQRPIVVGLNRLHPFKGMVYLVEAVPYVRSAGIEPQVLIVGPNRTTPRFGDYGAFLSRRAAELDVARYVLLTGGIPHTDVLTHLAGADVAVVPSVAEAFSRVVIEACAVGTPPVVTRTTGASEYVAAACAGIVVEPRSGPAIGSALVKLLSDPVGWREYSKQAVSLAPAFSSARIAAALVNLYRSAMASH